MSAMRLRAFISRERCGIKSLGEAVHVLTIEE
jgi:hypothetical protein